MTDNFDSLSLGELLPLYYSRLFPVNLMYRWLSYGNDETFSNREFSFTLPGDVYIRYQSFANSDEFLKELKRKKPEKIDIGAVYNVKPKNKDVSGEFIPLQKEFVLDIDMTDYDEVRTCCDGAKVCQKCWKFLGVAVEVLDAALREDFGFKHLLWVFSGRRGVHCWISDEVARFLDSSGRSAVAEYLTIIRGGENKAKKVKLFDQVHPSISRAIGIINQHFDTICVEEQELFSKSQEKLLNILPDDLKSKIKRETGNKDRWNAILNWDLDKRRDKNVSKKPKDVDELKLQFCYPRLDINVSKGLNHLLKSPFCIHPKTGKVCVPFTPNQAFSFDLDNVPTLSGIIDQISEHELKNPNEANTCDWKKTSLAPYMEIFKKFVKRMETEEFAKKVKSEPLTNEGAMEF